MNKLKLKGWKKSYYAVSNYKKGGMVIIVLGKLDFKTNVCKGNDGYFLMIKLLIHWDYITVRNIPAPNK